MSRKAPKKTDKKDVKKPKENIKKSESVKETQKEDAKEGKDTPKIDKKEKLNRPPADKSTAQENPKFIDLNKDVSENKTPFTPQEIGSFSDVEENKPDMQDGDFTDKEKEDRKKIESQPNNFAPLLTFGIDKTISIGAKSFPKYVKNEPLTEDEIKRLSDALEAAYPDIDISPKLAFWLLLMGIVVSRNNLI